MPPGNLPGEEEPPSPPGQSEPETRGERQEHQPQGNPRDYLANERTLLAWLRTGIALIALGFVVARFGLFLRELASQGKQVAPGALGGHASSIFGTIIVLLAGVLLALSYLRYRRTVQALDQGMFRASVGLVAGVVAVVILIALGLAVYLLLTS